MGDTDMTNLEFSVGLRFTCATEFRDVVKEYARKNGRNVKFIKMRRIE